MSFLQNLKDGLGIIMGRGFDGATSTQFRSNYAFSRSPEGTEDSVIGSHDRLRLQLECRYMYRNNPLARGVIDRIASFAVFGGIKPQARTSSPEWNKEAELWWNNVFVNTCDYRQEQGVTLESFQKMNIRERMVAGEMGYILLKNGQIQPIEASRICTPSDYAKDEQVVEGIRRSKQGIIVGYYVCDRTQGGGIDNTKFKYIRKENFIHCWEATRPDMIRGIPDLAPIIPVLRDYKETDENVRAKIKADAMTWGMAKKNMAGIGMRNRGSYKVEESTDTNLQRVEKVEGLRLLNMRPDESVDPFDSKTPNSEYVKYQTHLIQIMSQALGIPYEFMILMVTGNFSGSRLGMIWTHHTILEWVNWENRVFNRRLWNWRIAKAIKDGTLPPAPAVNGQSEWWKVEWSLPFWQEIDTDKQAKGDLTEWKMGKKSLKTIIGATGRDRNDVLSEKADDIVVAEQIAEEKLGDKRRYKEILDSSQPGDTTGNVPEKEEE